jgi:hypothetical protein
MSFGMKGREYM